MTGTDLETASEVLFYKPGIRCTNIVQLDEVRDERTDKLVKVEPGVAIGLTFEISPDADLGEIFLRVRTEKKMSELLSFWVTPFPVINEEHIFADGEKEGNDTPARAQAIPMNSTVVGYSGSGSVNDYDVYKVALANGQVCTAQILNARLGTHHYGGLTDMALEVRSPSGTRIARCDDSPLFAQDPVVSFVASEAGDYFITVRQQMDFESPLLHYGLHVGDFPRCAVTFPLGGPAGEALDMEVMQLDGSVRSIKQVLPAKVGRYEAALIDLETGPLVPSPSRLKVASFRNVLEQPGCHTPEKAQVIDGTLPVALNGIIKTEGEKDWYRFSAKKGERYRVRVYAQTLGSKLDAFVWIKPAEGNPSRRLYEEDDSLWDGHDWEGNRSRHHVKDRLDPIFMFEPDEDGDYLIGVGDTRRESGHDYVYRVEFQPHEDAVFPFFPPYPSSSEIVRDVIGIHRGSSVTQPIAIQNGFGSRYDGPMRLEAVGLPKDITFDCPVFTKNDAIILATFSAAVDAPLQAGLFEFRPVALEEGVEIGGGFAHTSPSTDRRGGYAMVFNRTRKVAIAVLEEAPFNVRIEQPKIGLAKNAEMGLKVMVDRKQGFEGAVYLEMDWVPPGVTKQPPLLIEEGEGEGLYRVSATGNARAGTYALSITAREKEGGVPQNGLGYHYIASPFVEIEIQDPYVEVTLQRAAIEQGTVGKFVGTVKHLRPFPGTAIARLLRLPSGVELVKEAQITAGQKEIVFEVKVHPDALTGQYKEIGCDMAITDAGQTVHQQTGDGVLRVDQKRN